MLLRPEKLLKKRGTTGQQLELPSPEDNLARLRRRRRTLTFTLILTVGLSLVFWLFRSLSSLKINFHLPSANPSLSLPPLPQNLSLFVQSGSLTWSQNFNHDSAKIISALDQAKVSSDHLLADSLPPGVEVRQIIDTTLYSYSITVPGKKIYLLLDLSAYQKSELPKIAAKIYWALIRE